MPFNLLIFKKIKEGDIRAFENLFRSYYEPLCRYARQFVENTNTAEEIVQDLFYVLWKEREKFIAVNFNITPKSGSEILLIFPVFVQFFIQFSLRLVKIHYFCSRF